MSSRKIGLYLILAGIVILAFKLSFNTGVDLYPEYKTSYSVVGEFQAFTLDYFYGANELDPDSSSIDVRYTGLRIDVFSNIIGYILIIIGSIKLKDVSKVFSLSRLLAYVGLVLAIIIKILPFVLNGYKLCCIALVIGIAELFASMSVGYLFVYAICTILNDIAFKTDRTYIGLCYMGMSILMIVSAFITWVQTVSGFLLLVYQLLLIFVVGLLIYNIVKVGDYIIEERGL